MDKVIMILIGIVIYLAQVVLFYGIGYSEGQKKTLPKIYGKLVITHDSNGEGPYLFLELDETPDALKNGQLVSFSTDKKDIVEEVIKVNKHE